VEWFMKQIILGGTYHMVFSLFPHPIPLLTSLPTVERLEDKNETMKKEMKELHDRNIGVRMFGGSRRVRNTHIQHMQRNQMLGQCSKP